MILKKSNLSELLFNSNINDFWRVIRLKQNKKGKVPKFLKELHHNRSNIGSTLLCVNEIISAKKLLKKGKGDGNISSMSDYIINMSHRFSIF